MRRPVAYLRRSAADENSPGDVSRAVQEHAVQELAHRDGFNGDVTYYVDWARSADEEKAARRTAYAEMLKEIETGRVSHVYAYALDRLNRSLTLTARFAKACEEKDVRIITAREGEVRQDTPSEWLRWTTLAMFGEFELRTIKARAATARERRLARGDDMSAPYGFRLERQEDGSIKRVRDESVDMDRIIGAYRTAGSVLGACRRLEKEEVPAPRGGKRWATSALTRILERESPELLPRRAATSATMSRLGLRSPSRAKFGHLLRCPFCGRMLTPNRARGQYYCANGRFEREMHPRQTVTEKDIRPALMAEAARYRAPVDAVELDNVEAERRAIERRLDKARELFLSDPDAERELYDAEKKHAKQALEALDSKSTLSTLHPEIDWEVDDATINMALRSIWREVRLDDSFRPLPDGVEWIFPELRS